jgi:L-aspartate oxidase
MNVTHLDLLVLGSGVAGLSAAVRAADGHDMAVGVLTKGEIQQTTTRWAQGGVAAVLGSDPDSTDLHLADTIAAGDDLGDIDAVRVLVDEGPERVNELIAMGAQFDRDAAGQFSLAREGGHSVPRVLHAGGAATGMEIERALCEAVTATAAAVYERWFAADLLMDGETCAGVLARGADGSVREIRATHVLMAAGGAGQLYEVTTNPLASTGDGIAMALRAGAALGDLEFVQFHPTALHHPQMPKPLLSEALRGHGALLRDANGERFVDELLPRDEVSRAMTRRMIEQDVTHLWLDATGLDRFSDRFPTIHRTLTEVGVDPASEWIPIAPAAHYLCGGIVTDLSGASSVPRLWAAGEVTCTGVHGANRLASNSLLEGMVFGPRAIEAIEAGQEGPSPTGAMRSVLGTDAEIPGRSISVALPPPTVDPGDAAARRTTLQRAMTVGAGVLRSADSLAAARETVQALCPPDDPTHLDQAELRNLVHLAVALLEAASARDETRGAHTRSDAPAPSEDKYRVIVRSIAN